MADEPIKSEEKGDRNPDGTYKPGHPGGPGRPKGQSLKEWVREKLMNMNEEERAEFIKGLSSDIIWRMAEGNPAQDVTSGGEKINPTPIYGGISGHNSDQKDLPA